MKIIMTTITYLDRDDFCNIKQENFTIIIIIIIIIIIMIIILIIITRIVNNLDRDIFAM